MGNNGKITVKELIYCFLAFIGFCAMASEPISTVGFLMNIAGLGLMLFSFSKLGVLKFE